MNSQTIFYIIIGILVFQYLFDLLLDFLNRSRWSETLPEELDGIYSAEKYAKHIEYKKANFWFQIFSDAVSTFILLSVLFMGGFAMLNDWVMSVSDSAVLQALLFFGTIGLASTIISLPFTVYGTFVIEERFGFNKTTPKIFILDLFKSLLLGAVIGGVLLSLIVWIYGLTGANFWLYAWILTSAFMIFMSMFYVFSLFVSSPALSGALGIEDPNFHVGLLVFGMLYTPVSFVLGVIMGAVSRTNEFAADAFAAKTSSGKALGDALKIISVKSLSNLTPHPWYVFFHYSHPPLIERLNALNGI